MIIVIAIIILSVLFLIFGIDRDTAPSAEHTDNNLKQKHGLFLMGIAGRKDYKVWGKPMEVSGYTFEHFFTKDQPYFWLLTPLKARVTFLPPRTILEGWNHPEHDEKWQHWMVGGIVDSGSVEVKILKRFTEPKLYFWVESTKNRVKLTVFPHHGHYHGHIHEPMKNKHIRYIEGI